ncbi:unnamed protein product [Scytosiphon promiscuus]
MGPKPVLLDGESLTNVVKPTSYILARKRSGGGEFHGALHITNFRLILQRTGATKDAFGSEDPSLQWVSFPMGCIKAVTQAEDNALAITILAKDLRSCRMRFPSKNALFVSTLTQIIGSMAAFTQTSPERSFAIGHAAAATRRRAADLAGAIKVHQTWYVPGVLSTAMISGISDARIADRSSGGSVDGWLIFDEETEFVRLGLIKARSLDSPARTGVADATSTAADSHGSKAEKTASGEVDGSPRWRLFHNRFFKLVPSYPMHFIVPAVMSDADVRCALAAYRSKGRLPAVTWMDPKTNAVLARSAQPLAGLGGKSCAEDARLLGLFGEKGKPAEGKPPKQPPSPGDGKGIVLTPGASSGGGSDRHRRRPRTSLSLPPKPRSHRGGSGARAPEEAQETTLSPASGEDNRGGQSGGRAVVKRASRESFGGGGESLLEAFGISSWTPPWSTTKEQVQVQTQTQTQTQEGPPELEALRDGDGNGGTPVVVKGYGKEALDTATRPAAASSRRSEQKAGRGGGKATAESAVVDARGRGADKPRREPPRLCVLDARTAVAALGNQLVGKGIETGAGWGSSTQLVFSGIGNVHAVKDAFEELRDSLDPVKVESKMDRWKGDSSKMFARRVSRSLGFARTMDLKYALGDELGGDELEETAPYTLWPRLLRQILGASVLAARLLRLKGCSVLVHCSDGWDRTPQICSTVELLLDPYYRTLEGFCVLVEKEFVSVLRSFWSRCMGGSHEDVKDATAATAGGDEASTIRSMKDFTGGQVREYDELSPVFLQFLDLVHNVLAQFPTAFEFTEELLTFVAEHTYSGLFGTFLCDTEQRRSRLKIKSRTMSVWTAVLNNKGAFANPVYMKTKEPLWPSVTPTKIRLWERHHCRVPSTRPQHLFSTRLWEDNVSFTCRLERGEFHLGVQQGGAGTQPEDDRGATSSYY